MSRSRPKFRKFIRQLTKLLVKMNVDELRGSSSAIRSLLDDEGQPDPHKLADELLRRHFTYQRVSTLAFSRSRFWLWEYGRYLGLRDTELRAIVNQGLRVLLDELEINKPVTQSMATNVVQALQGMCLVREPIEPPAWIGNRPRPVESDLLAMNNGLLSIERALRGKPCLLEHTPEWFSRTSWGFNYDPEADCPTWKTFLKQVLPDRKARKLLAEFLGYCLTFDTSFHRFLILVGEGANGKSVVTEVMTHVIGPDNVTQVGIERFGDRFALAPTVGALANIVSEIGPVTRKGEEMLKAIVGGDRIRVEWKFKDPVDVPPTVRLIFATNQLPGFADHSEGIWRRLLALPFEVEIPEEEQDPHLAKRICERELPGIFNWALRGLKRLRKQGGFTIPSSVKRAVEQHRQESNTARAFLQEYFVSDPNAQVSCGKVYRDYRWWCERQNLRIVDRSQFGREVDRLFKNVQRKQLRDGPGRAYYYVGLRDVGPMTGPK